MMKKLKKFKCGLFVLLFVLLSIGLFLGFSDKSHAWTGDVPLCSTYYSEWDDWTHKDTYMWQLKEIVQNDLSIDLFASTTSFVLKAPPSGDLSLYVTESPNRFVFHATGSTRRLRMYNNDTHTTPYPTGYHAIDLISLSNSNDFDDLADYVTVTTSTGIFGSSVNNPANVAINNNANCIQSVYNVQYNTVWQTAEMQEWGNELEPTPPDENCSPFDFGCWLTNLVETVDETFQSVFEAIGKLLTWIFVPDPEYIQPLIENFTDTLQDRLGILWIPFDLLIAFLQVFTSGNPDNWIQPNHLYCSGSTTATLFGKTVRIYDFIPYCKVILNSGPPTGYSITPVYPLVELVMNFFRMAFFLAVCGLFYHKVKELLHK